MKHFLSTAILMASLAVLAGCPAKPPPQPPPPAADNTGSSSGVADANANVDETDAAGPSGELLSKRIIYFDFDKAEIRADSLPVVAAHAQYLSRNPAQKVRLEGHADERGSRE